AVASGQQKHGPGRPIRGDRGEGAATDGHPGRSAVVVPGATVGGEDGRGVSVLGHGTLTARGLSMTINHMNTLEQSVIPVKLMAELQQAVEDAVKGVR